MNRLITRLTVIPALLIAACQSPLNTPKGNVEENPIIISEIGAETKYIELYNTSDTDWDISGMQLRKNNNEWFVDTYSTTAFKVMEGTILKAKSYAVIFCKLNLTDVPSMMLGISATGVSGKKSLLIELTDRWGRRVDYFCNSAHLQPRAVDEWDMEAEYCFRSAGRYGKDTSTWWVLDTQTPGQSNQTATRLRRLQNTKVDFAAAKPNTPTTTGKEYVFDRQSIPNLHITVEEEQWNKLLQYYDLYNQTSKYIKCNVEFEKQGTKTHVEQAGLRLRGKTSRRRPEGSAGQLHTTNHTDWHHFHFGINLRKFVKDDNQHIKGVKRFNCKWSKDDPTYVREMFSYDLMRRFGIWTAIDAVYCRVWFGVGSDQNEAYYGVYSLMEAVDDDYLECRADHFDRTDGNLWRCRQGATLTSTNDPDFGADTGDNEMEYLYELKTNTDNFAEARQQLKAFNSKVSTLTGKAFHDWIGSVCDVKLLMRTYATLVGLGMWDDYWNGANNFFVYLTGQGESCKFYFIPYDNDSVLGTSLNWYAISDPATKDPLNWGAPDRCPLIYKCLQSADYRAWYVEALNCLVDKDNDLLYHSAAGRRITEWQNRISDHVSNDTGEDMTIADRTAPWSNCPQYRLTNNDPQTNFFRVKAQSIATMQQGQNN